MMMVTIQPLDERTAPDAYDAYDEFARVELKGRPRVHAADEGRAFVATTVVPALEAVRAVVARDGAEGRVLNCQTQARLVVVSGGQQEFSYAVRVRLTERGAVPFCEASGRNGGRWRWSEDFGSSAAASRVVDDVTADEVARHALVCYAEERARN